MPIKGWTKTEAESRARLWALQSPRSQASHVAELDSEWSEWVVVTRHPKEPTTAQRKPRPGLVRSKAWKVIP